MKQAVLWLFLALLCFGLWRSSFSEFHGPLFGEPSGSISEEARQALEQPFRFLGKGRQSAAFVSADGKWVLKFFKQSYFKIPFWASFVPNTRAKREKREAYYRSSYRIASQFLGKETGIAYLHQGPSPELLPKIIAADRSGRNHTVDLNELPFVLQRKAEPLFPALEALSPGPFGEALDQFVSLVASRLELGIGDGDHEVEGNFGLLDGRVVQIDPGRLYLAAGPWEKEEIEYEWWSATHALRKWLEKRHPEYLSRFDSAIETNLRKDLPPYPTSPSPQIDGLLRGQSQAVSDN